MKNGNFGLFFVGKSIEIVDNFMQFTIVEKSIYRCKATNQPLLGALEKIVQISEFAVLIHVFLCEE